MFDLRKARLGTQRGAHKGPLLKIVCIFAGLILFCVMPVLAQENSAPPPSDLLDTNLKLVAASRSQIMAVLKSNPGLLLELKNWFAKDAADHGQIVQEDDVSDAAIYTRLAQDDKFRAAATRLLQRYGYLLPTINPDSDLARERDARLQAKISQALAEKQSSPEPSNQVSPIFPPQTKPPIRGTVGNPPELPRDASSSEVLFNASTDSVGSGAAGAPTGQAAMLRKARAEIGPYSASSVPQVSSLPLPSSSAPELSTLPMADSSAPEPVSASAPAGRLANRAGSGVEVASEKRIPGVKTNKSPYSDIPSLYDIYTHAETSSDKVTRFGEEIFENPPSDSGTIPIDFPASSDYVVGPGDGLTINLWGGVSQRLYNTVDHEGRITLPEVGPVLVSGHSLSQVQQAVQRLLRTQFRDVSADVSLSRLRTVRVYVVGDVQNPGAYDVSSLSTPLNALLAAGGPSAGGSLRVVLHYQGNTLVQQVDLYDLLLRGVRSDVKPLQSGDTLLVPSVGPQVRVDGMVRRPAIYELHGEANLAQVIDMAGGILPTAALSHIEVQRLEAHQKRTMMSLDISGTTDPSEIEKKLAAFKINDRDEIHIFPIASFNQDAVYLEGHVLRQGRYAYKPGIRLTDLISSYADLLPEPSTNYAEIIHLNPPDYHPSVQSFDLAAALADPASAPKLHPLDTVRIFSRFDFEAVPTVSVTGPVRHPGSYKTPGQIHFRDAIQLAGGLAPDADSAQIIRPMKDGSLTILSVQLQRAMEGDPINNVLLQPRDHILVQQSLQRADPRSVQIGGQVLHPGRYPLTATMHISDLIRLAGGLKRGADAERADLTQFIPENEGAIRTAHVSVNLEAAMTGNSKQDLRLHDGDVLTIGQVAGWSDLGAMVQVQGEVKHPGAYGIRPGERLSSVLERAGGFQPQGYPYGAVLERPQVQQLEAQSRNQMILRVKDAQASLALQPDTDLKQKIARELATQQWQTALDQLSANPPVGRIAIQITPDIHRWKDTPSDIRLQAGDTLIIPKRPDYVMVTGQVFNPTAIAFQPGKSAKWYLGQSGGPTPLAYKKGIFVVRADGSVIGRQKGLWTGDSLNSELRPGDTVVVPEKALSGNVHWQSVLLTAQVASSIASTVFIALRY